MPMSKERLYLFDTTLRDGAQMNGVDFTLADKLRVMRLLDDLGLDYVEGGYPGANPTDTALFSEARGLRAKFTAFGMTKRVGRSASNDPGLAATLAAKADAICLVGKSSAFQVRVALAVKPEENLAAIKESIAAAKATGREVLIDCEHFFDGYKDDAKYALAARSTSLTRLSSAFSCRSRRFSSTMSVVGRSSRSPRSAWSCRIQLRNASG